MVEVIFGNDFIKSVGLLPQQAHKKLSVSLGFLQQSIFHPLLHAKKLEGALDGVYAFRLSRDWRVIFELIDRDVVRLLRVKHRKDAYR